jgi:hypothetical protein
MKKTLIFLLFCVLSASELIPTESTLPPPTTCKPCPASTDPFCETEQALDSCECYTVCCSIAACEFGFEYCDSCSHCKCNVGPTSTESTTLKPICNDPCPKSLSRFCNFVKDPVTCECLEQCCDVINCPQGYKYCDSCDHCKCKDGKKTKRPRKF